jgi:hypothetical protein
MRPIDAPAGFTVDVDVRGFTDEVRAVSPDFELRTVEAGQPVTQVRNSGRGKAEIRPSLVTAQVRVLSKAWPS